MKLEEVKIPIFYTKYPVTIPLKRVRKTFKVVEILETLISQLLHQYKHSSYKYGAHKL